MTDKFIRVKNAEEAARAVKYFEDMGYTLCDYFRTNYDPDCDKSVVAEENDKSVWHSQNTDFWDEEHFLPEEKKEIKPLDQHCFILVNSQAEVDAAIEYFESLGAEKQYLTNEYSSNSISFAVHRGKIYVSGYGIEDWYTCCPAAKQYKLEPVTTYNITEIIPEKMYKFNDKEYNKSEIQSLVRAYKKIMIELEDLINT